MRVNLPLTVICASLTLLVAGCSTLSGPQAGDDPAKQSQPAAGSTATPTQNARSATTARDPASEGDNLPNLSLSREVLFQVLAAEIAAQRGQLGTASVTFLALSRSTKDPRFARRATELALADRSLDRALASARVWYELSPANPTALQTLEALFLANGNLTEVEPLLATRLNRARTENTLPQAYGQMQRMLLRATEPAAALALLQRLAARDLGLIEARLALGALADAARDQERSAAEYRAALALKPTDAALAVQAAQAVARSSAGSLPALQLLSDFLNTNPAASEARFAYARLLAQLERNAEAQTQMDQALKDDPENPNILYAMAGLAYRLKQPEIAKQHLQRYIALPRTVQRDNMPAFLFLAQIAEEQNQLPEAIQWLEQVNRGESFLSAIVQRALLTSKLGKLDAALELLRSTNVPTNRERIQLTSAEAQLLREANRPADAFDVLDKALERLPNNPELLYDHGMAAERIDKIDVMERSMRKLIELRPDHAHAHNALGYTLADRNMRLDEALKLITRALELLPKDPHIIDSMGWVLYRQGKLVEAEKYLRQAFEIKPEAEVATHLGEVLWQQGKTAEARKLWQQAMQLDPANQTLRETLTRFKVSLQ